MRRQAPQTPPAARRRRRITAPAMTLGAAAALAASAAAALGATDAQTPVPVGHATEQVEMGDRYLWTAGGRYLTRIEPGALRVRGSRTLPLPVSGLAAEGGAVWVQTSRGTWRVGERTLAPRRVARAREGGAIAAGEDGVWFADGRRVRRIDPKTARPDGVAATLPTGVGALALGEGALWVASATRARVWKLDPSTGRRLSTTALTRPGDHEDCGAPAATLAAGGGTVWAAFGDTPRCPDRAPRVVAIDPGTGELRGGVDDPSEDLPESRPRPAALAATKGGAWYARSNLTFTDGSADGPSALMRLRRTAKSVDFEPDGLEWSAVNDRVVAEPGHPRDIATGAGAVWIARSSSVVRVGPVRPVHRASVEIAGLRDVAAVGNRIWTLTDDGLERIDGRTGRPTGVRRPLTGQRLLSDDRRIWLLDGERLSSHDPESGEQLNWLPLVQPRPALLTVGHGSAVAGSDDQAPRGALVLLRQSIFTGHHTGTSTPVRPSSAGGLVFDAITAAPEGAWYLGRQAVRVDRLGRVVRRQRLGAARAITAATVRGGRLWVADASEGLLTLPATGGAVTPVPSIPVPTRLAADARSVWVLSSATRFADRIGIRTGRRLHPPVEVPELANGEAGLAAGADSLWIAEPGPNGRLTRIALTR